MTAFWVLCAAVAALTVANRRYRFDGDDRSGVNTLGAGLRARARYGPFVLRKALVHGVLSCLLCLALLWASGGLYARSGGATALAGVGWEWSQRFYRLGDLAGDAAGIALACLLWWLW